MEKLIDYFGQLFFKFIKGREKFFISLQKNRSKQIIFLLSCLFPFALILAFFLSSSFYARLWIFLGYMFIAFLTILFTAFYFRGKEMYSSYKHGLEMVSTNFYNKDYNKLHFTEEDIENLNLLSEGLEVKSKINNRNMVKNGKAANYFFVFSIMHRFVKGGVIDIETNKRKILFDLIETSFLMNSKNVKPDTLASSFSRWNSDMKRSEKVVLEYEKVIDVLGKQ